MLSTQWRDVYKRQGVNRRLKENNMKSKLVLQVHDELLIEAYEEELEDVKEIDVYKRQIPACQTSS